VRSLAGEEFSGTMDAPTTPANSLWLRLGLKPGERPVLFDEVADAATDTDLPFWVVLMLSGAIATLGLTLNSTAVVIGAMLVAPLLGPLMGLSLSVAAGDGRLFVQTLVVIFVGAFGVVALAALISWIMPFSTVTDEIAARTRPNLLDLAIAVFSGLAGAVVLASRESRLSGSIPGVAVAVALVPPLGVAGFGVGTGFQWPIINGALLLFGANLAGIVLAGLGVFLLVGMARPEVRDAAQRWHTQSRSTGLARACADWRVTDSLSLVSTPARRIAATMAFVVIVSVPLAKSFGVIVREVRVATAADAAQAEIERSGNAVVLERQVTESDGQATVNFRIATQTRIDDAQRERLAKAMSRDAGEPVTLTIRQIAVSSGELKQAANALPDRPVTRAEPTVRTTADLLAPLEDRLKGGLDGVVLPPGAAILGAGLTVSAGGPPALTVTYGAPAPLQPQTEALVAAQAAAALSLDPAGASVRFVPTGVGAAPEEGQGPALAARLATAPKLAITLVHPEGAPGERLATMAAALRARFGTRVAEAVGPPALIGCVARVDAPGCALPASLAPPPVAPAPVAPPPVASGAR